MKASAKKGQEKPKCVKKWVRQNKKEHIKLPIFDLLKIFILSWSKSLKSFKLIAFIVLERFLGSHLWLLPHSSPSLPYTERIHRGHTEKGEIIFLIFYSEFLNIVKVSFWILNALNRNSNCATFRLNLILFGCISLISRLFVGYVYFKGLLLLHSLYLTCPF